MSEDDLGRALRDLIYALVLLFLAVFVIGSAAGFAVGTAGSLASSRRT
jgi:hypothetical protein